MKGLIVFILAMVSLTLLPACALEETGARPVSVLDETETTQIQIEEETGTGQTPGQAQQEEVETRPVTDQESTEPYTTITITVTYDNNSYDSRLKTAWGFSCVIRRSEEAILFDTGGDGSILLQNMAELGIDPEEIDVVVLSHIHKDHVGGLASFLEQNSHVTVYVPVSFPEQLKDEVRLHGAKLEEIYEAKELFEDIFTTGELDGEIKEQSLVLRTPQGLVVVTGCAHPGIVNVVRKAKEIGKDKVYLLVGGFNLSKVSVLQIESIIQDFAKLGVEKVAPCHCTGDTARRLFQEHLGQNYMECGVGRETSVPQ